MLRHQMAREMKHSEQHVQQSLEILNNVAVSNLQITTAITEIIRKITGAPLLGKESTFSTPRRLTGHSQTSYSHTGYDVPQFT